MTRAASVALALGVLVTGCAGAQDAAIAQTASAFSAALVAGDGDAACDLLAPRTRQELESSAATPCSKAVLDLPAVEDVVTVQRFGREGQVQLVGATGRNDTYFLSRFDGRWLVTAAGCTPRSDIPYECDVEGP